MQEDIINSALEGRDTLAILPTGGGKSVCFQVPALMSDGLAIVVTPLIALMKDQVQNLSEKGIRAIAIHLGMTRREIDLALNNATYGDYKFLYVSPERLHTELFQSYLQAMDVSYIVIDEAHCISQWGYDFRPNYLEIAKIREYTDAPVIALTATATPEVALDIMDKLGFKENNLLKSGFERPNLNYIVRQAEDKLGQLMSIVSSVQGTGVVYVRNRKKCEELSALLQVAGHSASFYHAGLGAQSRAQRQAEWKCGKTRVMVCTNAFGMGIDKSDVRFVVHFDVPDCLEAYFQEAGRAGRDGLRSYAVLLWNSIDVRRLKQLHTVSFPDLEYLEDIYHKVCIYAQIPYDAGIGRQIKFDIADFCKKFSLNMSTAYYAIKYLEKVGHWTMSEDMEISTRIQISVSRTELYHVEFADPSMLAVLDRLMRTYTGIFSFPVPIDEEYIASQTGLTVARLRQVLYMLSLEHVVKYLPADNATVIYMHNNRLRPKNVNLKPELYSRLKDTSSERMLSILGYISQDDTCRSRYVLSYFGQTETEDCGTCDVCRKKGVKKEKSPKSVDLKDSIKSYIGARPEGYALSDLVRELSSPGSFSKDEVVAELRNLIDAQEIPAPGHRMRR